MIEEIKTPGTEDLIPTEQDTFYTELTARLHAIQRNLNAPKNLFNSFGKYKYRSCEGILEAVKPLLDGTTLTLSDQIKMVGDRFYIEATATFSDGQESVSVTAYAREPESKKGMDESQITGAASSYARKYALNGLFLIDDTKDADDLNKHETITVQQVGHLESLFDNSTFQNDPKGEKWAKGFANFTPDQYEKAVISLNAHQLHESEKLPNTSTGAHE